VTIFFTSATIITVMFIIDFLTTAVTVMIRGQGRSAITIAAATIVCATT
jgi:hypothetical protein